MFFTGISWENWVSWHPGSCREECKYLTHFIIVNSIGLRLLFFFLTFFVNFQGEPGNSGLKGKPGKPGGRVSYHHHRHRQASVVAVV